MPNINNLTESPRKDLHIFYLLDTSGSMEGEKISTLNHAMEETIEALKIEAKKNGDAKLKIAVLEFNTGCEWVTFNGPEDLEEDFEFEYLQAGGLTDVGQALHELNDKLSRSKYLNSITGAMMPIIIFMSDGFATDNYVAELEEIRKNRWFARATKIGFALGDDPDLNMISSVVGNSEAVIKTTDLELFKKLMKFVSVTSSMLVSKSRISNETANGAEIVKQIIEEEEEKLAKDIVVVLDEESYMPESNDDLSDEGWDDVDEW